MPFIIQTIARLILILLFAISGVSKLLDLKSTEAALNGFGVSRSLSRPLALLLPFAEIATASALLFNGLIRWGAIFALLLMILFSAVVSFKLLRGETPNCHCFGQLHSSPISWKLLVRNLLIAFLAIIIMVGDNSVFSSDIIVFAPQIIQNIPVLLGLVALAVACGTIWLLMHLWYQQGRLLLRIEHLEEELMLHPLSSQVARPVSQSSLKPGDVAPRFSLLDLKGTKTSLEKLLSNGKPVLLLFSDTQCGPCNALLPEVRQWQKQFESQLLIVLISNGYLDKNKPVTKEQELGFVLFQVNNEVTREYDIKGTPSAVVINTDGKIDSQVAGGANAIRELVEKSISKQGMVKVGQKTYSRNEIGRSNVRTS